MGTLSKYPSALASKLPSIGGKEKKLNWKPWTKSKRTYRVLWATTLGELETEVQRFLRSHDDVEFVGPPFHDLNWWQAITYTEKNKNAG
jgi:hypothetical protein